MKERTFDCDCPDKCGMKLTVKQLSGIGWKLTLTSRLPGVEPAIEWLTSGSLLIKLQDDLTEVCNIFRVEHFLKPELDADMFISNEDKQALFDWVTGVINEQEKNKQEWGDPRALQEHSGLPSDEPTGTNTG